MRPMTVSSFEFHMWCGRNTGSQCEKMVCTTGCDGSTWSCRIYEVTSSVHICQPRGFFF